MSQILIVHFSLSGVTKQVVDMLGREIDATVIPIEAASPYRGVFGYLRAGYEALTGGAPEIKTRIHEPSRFPITVLATPVWAGKMSSPMRSYLTEHKGAFRKLAFLCTMGGSGAQSTFADMEKTAGQSPLATLFLREKQVRAGTIRPDVARFAAELQSALLAQAS